MDREDALDQIRRRYRCVDGPPCPYGPTGETYVTLVVGGPKIEGDEVKVYCKDEADAVRYWLADFWLWAADRPGVLYWRHWPEVETCVDGFFHRDARYEPAATFRPVPVAQVFSRVLLSDRPPLSYDEWHNRIGTHDAPMMSREEWDGRYFAI